MEQEDYLETIYLMEKEQDYVRISDIALSLNISKPSVTQMIQRLDKEGLVVYKPYSPVRLTKKGREIGKKIDERHQVLSEFLTLLEIPKEIQEKDIHGIEHFISPITLKKLKSAIDFLKKNNFK